MAAESLITFAELSKKLEKLEEVRRTEERELEAMSGRQAEVETLEQEAEALLASYAEIIPKGLDAFGPENRRWAYKLLKTQATVGPDGELDAVELCISRDAGGLSGSGSSIPGAHRYESPYFVEHLS